MKHNKNNPDRVVTSHAKKKMPVITKVLLILVIVLVAIAIGISIYFAYLLSTIEGDPLNESDLGITSNASISKVDREQITNILLFGIDSRNTSGQGHSDAIMVLTIDNKHQKVKVTSLMRDSYVRLQYTTKKGTAVDKMDKLTNAYWYGGPQLAVKTINANYNLNVTDYVTIDFFNLAKLIDAVGGIDIEITESERVWANKSIAEVAKIEGVNPPYISKSGKIHVNGAQAVGYARIRKVGNADFQRTERQRIVMKKLFEKAIAMKTSQYPKFIKELLPLVKTSLNSSEILSLGLDLLSLGTPQFAEARFPLNSDLKPNGYINGVSYVVFDQEVTNQKLHDFIYNDIDPLNPPSASSNASSNTSQAASGK